MSGVEGRPPVLIPKHQRKGLFWVYAAKGDRERFSSKVEGPFITERAESRAFNLETEGWNVRVMSNKDREIAGLPFGLNGSYREEDYFVSGSLEGGITEYSRNS